MEFPVRLSCGAAAFLKTKDFMYHRSLPHDGKSMVSRCIWSQSTAEYPMSHLGLIRVPRYHVDNVLEWQLPAMRQVYI